MLPGVAAPGVRRTRRSTGASPPGRARPGSPVRPISRDPAPQPEAAPAPRPNFYPTTGRADPLADSGNAVAACIAVARERAAAVIANVDHDPRGLVGERDFGGRT